jgi:alanyl-tRNA synthetase
VDLTESRLYYRDAYLAEFDARLVEQFLLGQAWGVVLDQTAFYPTSGGQPHDTGLLNGVTVTDVIEREEDKAIVHVVEQKLDGSLVRGQVDWARRFDLMQQHTGQHILSHAFEALLDADTVGFHLSDETLTIDISRAPLSLEDCAAVEGRANAVVFADYPVDAHFVSQAEVGRLPLRKPPAVKGPIRIVQVGSLDYSPCGGTHCRSSGAVGLIAIRKVERRGVETRIEFVCGGRALADYRRKNRALGEAAGQLSVGEMELPEAVSRLSEEVKAVHRQLKLAEDRLLEYEVTHWLARAEAIGDTRLVKAIIVERNAASVKYLAVRLMAEPRCVALLGLVQGNSAQLTFARSNELTIDMRPLLKEACRMIGGGGGGQPNMAQGGGSRTDQVLLALDAAARTVRAQIEQ